PIATVGESILETLNYRATSMTDALEALECARADPRAFDLVITDLSMPKLMGTDLVVQLLALRPDLPIILTTGYTTTLTAENVRALGIRELLLKPFSLRSLGTAVRDVLSRSEDDL